MRKAKTKEEKEQEEHRLARFIRGLLKEEMSAWVPGFSIMPVFKNYFEIELVTGDVLQVMVRYDRYDKAADVREWIQKGIHDEKGRRYLLSQGFTPDGSKLKEKRKSRERG